MTGRVAAAVIAAAAAVACGSSATTPVAKKTAPATSKKPKPEQPPPSGPLSPQELSTQPVVDVEIRGLARVSKDAVREAIKSSHDKPIDRGALRADLRRIMAVDGVSDVRVGADRSAGGIALIYTVTETPRVSAVSVEGNSALGSLEVRRMVGIEVGDWLDPLTLSTSLAEMQIKYQRAGHRKAEVEWSQKPDQNGVAVTVTVTEGPKFTISRITFPGSGAIKSAALAKLLSRSANANTTGGVLVEEEIDVAYLHIISAYYDRGYINCRVLPHVVRELGSGRIELEIPIEEGEQFRLGKLQVKGKLSAPVGDYRKEIKSKTGRVFNRSKLSADIQRLQAFHKRAGGAATDVVMPLTDIDQEKRRVDITFEIGP